MSVVSLRTKLALLASDRADDALASGDLLGAARQWSSARRTLKAPGCPLDTAWSNAADRARALYIATL